MMIALLGAALCAVNTWIALEVLERQGDSAKFCWRPRRRNGCWQHQNLVDFDRSIP